MRTGAFQTLRSVTLGYAPRAWQGRGWVLAALAVLPGLLAFLAHALSRGGEGLDARLSLQVFHGALVPLVLPIMAIVAAPGGIREDLEQRTLPLLLIRPARVGMLPLARGLVLFLWGALWLLAAGLVQMLLGAAPESAGLQTLALVLAFWGELALMNLLVLRFKRGTLWGAVLFFAWENLLRVLPATLQRFTFLHHIESIAGSREGVSSGIGILAQDQITSPVLLSVAVLILVGLVCWGLCGLWLKRTPLGLTGRQSEG
jgi:hypothetical protein